MENRECTLTISILASNRKDTLPKTLESIKPILDNVSSELIVTDTGCDEELLELIRQYTTKIEKFTWCKDFSKARNVGLNRAKGQWFLYVDDDEWFEDVTPIIDFFNSDKCKIYNAFDYTQRNYITRDGKTWKDSPVSRAVKLVEGQCFVDKIHEHFAIDMKPAIHLASYVHHYGYVYESQKEKLNHSKRNISLLEEQYNSGNRTIRQYLHMLQEYNILERHEKSLELALEAVSVALKDEVQNYFLDGIKVNVVSSLINLDRNEEAIEKALEYLVEKKKGQGILGQSAICALYGYLAHGYDNVRDAKNAAYFAWKYLEAYKYLKDKPEQVMYESYLTIGIAFSDKMPNMVFNLGLRNAVSEEDIELIMNIASTKDAIGKCERVDDGSFLSKLVTLIAKNIRNLSNEFMEEKLTELAEVLVFYMDDVIAATKICGPLLDMVEKKDEAFYILTEKFIKVQSNSPYIKLLATIYNGN